MKITDSTLELDAQHQQTRRHDVRESLRAWRGERPEVGERGRGMNGAAGLMNAASDVRLSAQAHAAADAEQTAAIDTEATTSDARLDLLIRVIEFFTGRRVELFDPNELTPPPGGDSPASQPAPAGGAEYRRSEHIEEHERTELTARGVVRTADGQEIRFAFTLRMERHFEQTSQTEILVGNAKKKDPLVLNFAGTAAQLVDQQFQFDLDANGQTDALHQLAAGSAFLVFDRNGDGQANDGRELFGARTGNGFAELAALDDDGNGWIDAGDAAFGRLRLWRPGDAGGWQTLSGAGVGAIATAQVATPFALRGSANQAYGDIRSSGVYLKESGDAGSVQQIDLVV